jgi:hypothetical protein
VNTYDPADRIVYLHMAAGTDSYGIAVVGGGTGGPTAARPAFATSAGGVRAGSRRAGFDALSPAAVGPSSHCRSGTAHDVVGPPDPQPRNSQSRQG